MRFAYRCCAGLDDWFLNRTRYRTYSAASVYFRKGGADLCAPRGSRSEIYAVEDMDKDGWQK